MGLIARARTLWRGSPGHHTTPTHSRQAGFGTRSQLANAAFSLTPVQLERLIGGAVNHRDRALIRLFVETGVRRAEAAALTWQEVDTECRLLVIRNGKGGKLRLVPMTKKLLTALHEVRPDTGDGPVFRSRQYRPLSVRQVNRIVAAAGERAGVRHPNPRHRQVTCHLLRHTFARLWKAEGGSIESLSTIMGHSSPETTWQVYGTESLSDVQVNYDAMIGKMFGSPGTRGGQVKKTEDARKD